MELTSGMWLNLVDSKLRCFLYLDKCNGNLILVDWWPYFSCILQFKYIETSNIVSEFVNLGGQLELLWRLVLGLIDSQRVISLFLHRFSPQTSQSWENRYHKYIFKLFAIGTWSILSIVIIFFLISCFETLVFEAFWLYYLQIML